MRIVRYRGTDGPAWGVLGVDDRVRATSGTPFDDLVTGNDAGALSDLELLAPATPSKVIGVGRNYREHAAEFNNPVPEEPLLFMKPPSAIIGPGAEIHYPSLSKRVDPEAELVLVIGREAHRVPADRAMDFIGGYTCGNDVTARDIQKSDGQWTRGKGFDTFCPSAPGSKPIWTLPTFGSLHRRRRATPGRPHERPHLPGAVPDRVHQPIHAAPARRPDHDRHAGGRRADGGRKHGHRRGRGHRRAHQPGRG